MMTTRMIRGLRFLAVVTVVGLATGTGSIFAATRTWTGAGVDGNWSTAANWGGTAPVAGDDLVFPDGAARMTTNNNDLQLWTLFNSISFTGPAGGYNIAGNSISLGAGITTANGATNTISLDVRLAASQTFNVSGAGAGTLNFAGTIYPFNDTLTLAGPNGIVSLGPIIQSGTGGVSSSVGYAYLTANSTYTGPTTVSAGTFSIANSHSLSPSSAVTVSGGTLQFANNGSAGPVTVNPTATLFCGLGNVNGLGNVTDLSLQSGATLSLQMSTLSNYGQLNASGNVSLGGATLSLGWGFTSSTGNAFTIINKTSAGAITGTFNGLAEGATFTQGARTYQITYVGGNGNDVVVTDIGPAPIATPTPTPTPTPTATRTVTTTPTPGPNIPTTGGGGAIVFIFLLAGAGVLLVRRYVS